MLAPELLDSGPTVFRPEPKDGRVCCVAESLEEAATIGDLINVCFMMFQGMIAR